MDEVSQEQLDDAWDEGFAHGYSRGNEEGLKIAFKDGYDFGVKTVSAEFTAKIELLRDALKFYAGDGAWGEDSDDFGNVARAALKEKE